ncbi:hypothetical protein KA977_02540 [Candidatus Dependentiae bacterium]|nr:hypothetical protein [Candidatus Dependentiae bacterium]
MPDLFNKKITVEYSSMCLNEDNYLSKISEAKKIAELAGFNFGIQIHNSITKNLYDKLLELKNHIRFTVHSPVLAEYFFNLAHPDFENIKKQSANAVNHLKIFDTNIFFSHGFFMTDRLIPHDMANYRKILRANIPEKYCLDKSFIMNPSFFETEEFEYYKNIFKRNYLFLRNCYPDYIICFENDFVGVGSGLQRPIEIFELIDNLWLDTGHLWCSSLIHNFNFYEICEEIIEKKKIFGVHLNHNLMTEVTEKTKIRDSHSHLYNECSQNLKPIVRKLKEKGLNLFTLEIENGDIEDLKILIDWF